MNDAHTTTNKTMSVVIFGATGMIGRGVLMESLAAPEVSRVVSVTRRSANVTHEKLEEVIHDDFEDYSTIIAQIGRVDACFWCLGISSAGMNEADYTRITHGFTMTAANALFDTNPEMTFCFVSGSGADGAAMWARVKKRTEDELASVGFPRVIVARPAYVRGDHGGKPRGLLYRAGYAAFSTVGPLMRAFGGGTSNSEIGRAFITAARDRIDSTILSSAQLNELATRSSAPQARRSRGKTAFGVSLVALIATSVVLTQLGACASFGANPKDARLERMKQSPQWNGERFENKKPSVSEFSGGAPASDHQSPAEQLEPIKRSKRDYASPPASGLRVTWLGHSTMLLEIDGARVLIDPVWSRRASPFSFAGPERWYEPPLPLDELPKIDAVVISHDHYDHLDYETVIAMKSLEGMKWVVPLGVGAHLEHWGVAPEAIIELDWWDETEAGGVTLTATPARHFSGRRSIPNPSGGPTLWAGWSFAGAKHRVYYSGDTGLFDELIDIGERLGPFDLTMIEAGAYSHSARDIHLGPEQAVQAHRLVRGEIMMPVHWGLFDLNAHGWTEPIERVLIEAARHDVSVLSIEPGEMVELPPTPAPKRWWPDVPWNTAEQDPISSTSLERAKR